MRNRSTAPKELLSVLMAVLIAGACRPPSPPPSTSSTPPRLGRITLQHSNQPGMYVRLSNQAPAVAGIDRATETDLTDAHFEVRAGRSGSGCVSFESARYPGRFLRHQNDRIMLHGGSFWDPSYNDDATFCADGYRFQSFNKPGYYIRRSGAQLLLARLDAAGDEASIYDTVFIELPPVTLGEFCGYSDGTHVQGDFRINEAWGACTGLAGWSEPKVTCMAQAICDQLVPPNPSRTIVWCAAGTPFAGFYPWIRFTSWKQNGVIKFETERRICIF